MGKPLHVRVAEALGCNPVEYTAVHGLKDLAPQYACQCPGANKGEAHGDLLSIYRYDRDWAATGPLVDRYGITLYQVRKPNPREGVTGWAATASWHNEDGMEGAGCGGDTALQAVCNLVVELHRDGKMDRCRQ